jgi:hypothetical protein
MSAKINYKRKLKLATTTIYPVLGQILYREVNSAFATVRLWQPGAKGNENKFIPDIDSKTNGKM